MSHELMFGLTGPFRTSRTKVSLKKLKGWSINQRTTQQNLKAIFSYILYLGHVWEVQSPPGFWPNPGD